MKRHVIILLVAGLLTSVGSTFAGDVLVGVTRDFKLAQKVSIEARVTLLDTGDPSTGLVVSGRGDGFDPSQTYVSLIYDRDSVDEGPGACVPTGSTLKPAQMFVGFWTINFDGTGELNAIKMGGSFATLRDIGTLSIRQNVMGVNELLACSRVTAIPARSDRPEGDRGSFTMQGPQLSGISQK